MKSRFNVVFTIFSLLFSISNSSTPLEDNILTGDYRNTYHKPIGKYVTKNGMSEKASNNIVAIDDKLQVILEFEALPIIKSYQLAKNNLITKNSRKSFISSRKAEIASQQNATLSKLKALGLADSYGRQFNYLYNGASLVIDKKSLYDIAKVKGIKKVHVVEDRKLQLNSSVSLVEADRVWQLSDANDIGITGKGVRVAVIDTGVDYTRQELGGCLGEGCRVYDGFDFINDDDDPMDDQGHGTHVAGIIGAQGSIRGVAPDVTFAAYKVCDFYCPTEHIIAALERAIDPDGDPLTQDGVDIVNVSIGGGFALDDPLTVAVDELAKSGTLVVISAGNEGDGQHTITSPGNAKHALTVASTTKEDTVSYFSSRGPLLTDGYQKPEISAPGSDILSLGIAQGEVSLSGTSMAAPHVAGAAALLKQKYPHFDGKQLKSLLSTNTEDIGYQYYEMGAGRLNALKAVEAQVVLDRSYVMFERLDRSSNKVVLEETIELTNIADKDISINLGFSNESTAILYSVNEGETILLTPGQTKSIIVSVTIDTTLLPYSESLLHSANLLISSDEFSSSLPVLIFDAIKLNWSADQYTDSVWVHNKNSSKSKTFSYQESGEEYLLPGDYFVSSFINYGDSYAVVSKELANVKEDTEVSFSKTEAKYKIELNEFINHQGDLQALDSLYGGGTFIELAYPENLDRQYHFWTWQDSGYFSRYPVYISDIPEGLLFNFSFMAGDKNSSGSDYHAYVHTGSLSEINGDVFFTVNGVSEKQVVFDVLVPNYYQETFNWNWRLANILEIEPYRQQGWTRYAYFLEGPNSQMNADQLETSQDAFKLTLHGNEFSEERFGSYELRVGDDWPHAYMSGTIKFEEHGNYSAYSNWISYPQSVEHSDSPLYKIDGQGTFPNISPWWQDDSVLVESVLYGYRNSLISNKQFDSWLFICDNFVVKQTFLSRFYDYSQGKWTCLEKRIEYRFYNYLFGKKHLSNYVSHGGNHNAITQMTLKSEPSIEWPGQINYFIDITLNVVNETLTDESFHAWVNWSGAWQEVTTFLVDSELINWPTYAKYRISLPKLNTATLLSLKLEYDDDDSYFMFTQPNAYLLGGSKEELEALDGDGDGINDLEDNDKDNDGIPDDIELLNGLNPQDGSDASGDIDHDGISNIDEFIQGRFIRYYENDLDGDGVTDHLDDFPNNPSETTDTDRDGIGNNADTDDDGDGVEDSLDAFPLDPFESIDSDYDGIGDNADVDDDNDGVEDNLDAFPLDPYESTDSDFDGIGDNADMDDDNDGVEDNLDAFPLDPYESLDSDSDGIGNNTDADDDNDGVLDTNDPYPLDASRPGQGSTNNDKTHSASNSDSSGGSFAYMALLMLCIIYRRKKKLNL